MVYIIDTFPIIGYANWKHRSQMNLKYHYLAWMYYYNLNMDIKEKGFTIYTS